MKKQFIALLVIALALAGFFLYTQFIKPELNNRMVTTVVPTTISNEELGVGFVYPSGETGFALIEPPVPEGNADGLEKVYLIMSTEDYIAYQQIDNLDTPPSVSVFVFTMLDDILLDDSIDRTTKLKLWAEKYTKYSSYASRTAEPEMLDVDGVKAIRYQTKGLYDQEVYLMAYRGKVYMFVGQYQLENDRIREMFTDLISSVTFY